jgi:hypothetical protein
LAPLATTAAPAYTASAEGGVAGSTGGADVSRGDEATAGNVCAEAAGGTNPLRSTIATNVRAHRLLGICPDPSPLIS